MFHCYLSTVHRLSFFYFRVSPLLILDLPRTCTHAHTLKIAPAQRVGTSRRTAACNSKKKKSKKAHVDNGTLQPLPLPFV
jgi:hypothetical protein